MDLGGLYKRTTSQRYLWKVLAVCSCWTMRITSQKTFSEIQQNSTASSLCHKAISLHVFFQSRLLLQNASCIKMWASANHQILKCDCVSGQQIMLCSAFPKQSWEAPEGAFPHQSSGVGTCPVHHLRMCGPVIPAAWLLWLLGGKRIWHLKKFPGIHPCQKEQSSMVVFSLLAWTVHIFDVYEQSLASFFCPVLTTWSHWLASITYFPNVVWKWGFTKYPGLKELVKH